MAHLRKMEKGGVRGGVRLTVVHKIDLYLKLLNSLCMKIFMIYFMLHTFCGGLGGGGWGKGKGGPLRWAPLLGGMQNHAKCNKYWSNHFSYKICNRLALQGMVKDNDMHFFACHYLPHFLKGNEFMPLILYIRYINYPGQAGPVVSPYQPALWWDRGAPLGWRQGLDICTVGSYTVSE